MILQNLKMAFHFNVCVPLLFPEEAATGLTRRLTKILRIYSPFGKFYILSRPWSSLSEAIDLIFLFE